MKKKFKVVLGISAFSSAIAAIYSNNKGCKIGFSAFSALGLGILFEESWREAKKNVDKKMEKVQEDFTKSGLTPKTATVPTPEEDDENGYSFSESLFMNLHNSDKVADSVLELNYGVYPLEVLSVLTKSDREVRLMIPLSPQQNGRKIGPKDEDIYFKNVISELVEDYDINVDDVYFTKLGYEFVKREVNGEYVVESNRIEREVDEDTKTYVNRINSIIRSWETNQESMRIKAMETRGEDVLGYRMYLSVSLPIESKNDPRIGFDTITLTGFISDFIKEIHYISSPYGEKIERVFDFVAVCPKDTFDKVIDTYRDNKPSGETYLKPFASSLYISGEYGE